MVVVVGVKEGEGGWRGEKGSKKGEFPAFGSFVVWGYRREERKREAGCHGVDGTFDSGLQ